MGIRLIAEVLDHYHGPHIKKLWLLAFAETANDGTRQGWPGRRLLAHRADVSPARASNLATELAEDSVIKRVGGGGRYRGEARYELLPLTVGGEDQGSPIPNPGEPVDNSPQGSPRPNPKPEVKGSESGYQGSESGYQGSESGYQGSAISPLPAETPYNPQNPHEKQPSSLSPRARDVARLAVAGAPERGEKDDDVIEGKINPPPNGARPLAEEIAAAVPGMTTDDAESLIEHVRLDPKVQRPSAWLRAAIGNGTLPDLVADLSAKAALKAALFGDLPARPSPPSPGPDSRPPSPAVKEPGRPPWLDVACPTCGAEGGAYCRHPDGGTAATHQARRMAAAATQEEGRSE